MVLPRRRRPGRAGQRIAEDDRGREEGWRRASILRVSWRRPQLLGRGLRDRRTVHLAAGTEAVEAEPDHEPQFGPDGTTPPPRGGSGRPVRPHAGGATRGVRA